MEHRFLVTAFVISDSQDITAILKAE